MGGLKQKRWLVLPTLVTALSLLATGCSGDDDDAASGKDADLSVLGTPKKAEGAPVELAFITTGNTAAAYTHETEVANASVSYINEYLGGLNGRPIKLTICNDNLQANLARECANKAVGSPAVAVVGGAPSNPDAVTAVTSPAGVPFFVATGGGQQTLSLPNTYPISNSVGALIGLPAQVAKDKGAKKAALITIDVPILTGPLKALAPLVSASSGVQLDVVAVPPGTADMTPQIQAAVDGGAGLLQISGDESFCTAAFKAVATLGVKLPITTLESCVTPAAAKQIPGGYPGDTQVTASSDPDPDSDDSKLFRAVLAKYNATGNEDGMTAYWALLSLQRSLEGTPGELTRQSIIARLNAQPKPVAIPLLAGTTFQCGTKPVPITPNVCSGAILVGTVDSDGKVTDAKSLDVAPLFKVG